MSSLLNNQQSILAAVDFDPFADGELLLMAPTTESQQEIWAAVQMGSDANCAYNESQTLRLGGRLVVESLRAALHQLVMRHEALRTTFSPDGSSFCVAATADLEMRSIDLSQLSLADRKVRVAEIQQQVVEQPFDLEFGPLVRCQLLKLAEREHLLLVITHHIICDGWSWGVLIRDLGRLYSAAISGVTAELEEPERLSEYAIELVTASGSEEAIADEGYWMAQFAGDIPIVDLPTDRSRPALRTFDSARVDCDLSPLLVAQLQQFSVKAGCTLMTTLLAGFEVWLYRLTGQADLVVGVLAAGQAVTGRLKLVGHCVNLLPLRSRVDGAQSFDEYLQMRRVAVLDAYDRQQFTFGSLVQKLKLPRDASRIPLVPVLFNLDRAVDASLLEFGGLAVELCSNPRAYENFELFVNATEAAGKLTLECQYNTNLFDATTIQRRLAELETLLAGIVADPSCTMAMLPLLPPAERELLAQWQQTQANFPDVCIHHLFAAQVQRTPNAIAVRDRVCQLTYQELDRRANILAHQLRAAGVRPEVLVGISLERTAQMLVAILGVWKAGGAYVPLDPTYPRDRLTFMLEDAGVAVLVTQSDLVATIPPTQAQIVCLDREWIAEEANQPPELNQAEHLAYIIYTSGSTGTPKGVQVTHRNVVNFLTAMQHELRIDASDVLLSVTTLAFDIAVLELLLPLTVGATTVVVSTQVAIDGEALSAEIERTGCSWMQATPATWRMLIAAGWAGAPHLKLLCGGEALSSTLASQLRQRAASVWNMYGPTETTIWSTCDRLDGDTQPTIGRPIANTQIQLLDAHQQPVPIGIAGEIYISGAGVARGYLRRPELTTARFDRTPEGTWRYRTGDVGRYLADGRIEYLQRIDNQVKLRGFRIELGEIEATIALDPVVHAAVAMVREDRPDDRVLVGYVVLAQGADAARSIPQLREFLKGRLPDYLVPSVLMAIDRLPLTPNGKIDRRALPIPELQRQVIDRYVPPSTEVERQIVAIWEGVMKIDRVGVQDNFFDLGGYSLLAIQVMARLRQTLQIEIGLASLFELPTVAELAHRVETLLWAAQSRQVPHSDLAAEEEEGEL
jgi:amino acid adenylation domain-containing protein